ncbi:MAG: nuclear transport factor 2 family protein [Sphingomonadaceae bacterium]|uniref:nuclear transport factor 2 family protein n=1 Tax=Thermaurantiacus sp. TaxID=2820283 RepID=UPI00298F0B20|nr:nuclear transport factor 2 family protein [Thermaurantiacus sp.]MCS6987559.1 nuclear transport factor 2 family protein [Sphingomonadaceae bacterium]MDW8415160.1 nuclear transport factor 2 family protein [Thermaurantiacus sp.]
MQYDCALDRQGLIDLAIHRYFAAVDAKDLAGTLACFHPEALFTIQTSFTRHAGLPAIERMFRDFFAAWQTIVHRDFVLTVDEAHGRIAAAFEAVLTAPDGQVTRLSNTNFWRVRGEKFQEVYVYMSGANVLV